MLCVTCKKLWVKWGVAGRSGCFCDIVFNRQQLIKVNMSGSIEDFYPCNFVVFPDIQSNIFRYSLVDDILLSVVEPYVEVLLTVYAELS